MKRMSWTADEDSILRECWGAGGWAATRDRLPHRTRRAAATRASTLGVRGPWGGSVSKASLATRFARQVVAGDPAECWLWAGASSRKGYGRIHSGPGGTLRAAHRVAYELAHGPVPEGLFVCHRCDTPRCCNPAHLFLGTATDNNRDRDAKGRHGSRTKPEARARGEAHGHAKLTWADVRAIRAAPTGAALARHYGVSRSAIDRIRGGATWVETASP